MPPWITNLPLEHVNTLTIAYILAGVALAALMVPTIGVRTRLRTRLLITVGALVVGALIGLGLPFWLNAPELFGVTLSPVILIATSAAAAGLALVIANLVRTRWWRKVLAVALAPVIVGAGALMINEDVGYYPTLGDAFGLNAVGTLQVKATTPVPLVDWHAPEDLPAHGAVYRAVIPGVASHFHARDAWVYLPPAARTARPPSSQSSSRCPVSPGTHPMCSTAATSQRPWTPSRRVTTASPRSSSPPTSSARSRATRCASTPSSAARGPT